MRAIKQFIYKGGEYNSWKSGRVFSDTLPILELGIQAPPGTRFFLDGGYNPILIDGSGIFEIQSSGNSDIAGLCFSQKSLEKIKKLNGNLIIVDIVYEKEE